MIVLTLPETYVYVVHSVGIPIHTDGLLQAGAFGPTRETAPEGDWRRSLVGPSGTEENEHRRTGTDDAGSPFQGAI